MKLCQVALISTLLAGTATAGVEEWTSIHPAGPTGAIGGTIAALGYTDSGEAYLLSLLGYVHKRTAIAAPWTSVPAVVNGNPVLLADLSIGPGDPPVLLGKIGLDRLAYSPDGGATWTELSLPTTGIGSAGWVRSLAIAPSDPDLIYYTVRHSTWRSIDGGQTWEERTKTAPTSLSHIEVHPLSVSTLYGLSSGEWFTSIDGGQSWTSLNNGIDPDRNLNAIGVDPSSLQTLYTGGWRETYKSTDAAANWTLSAVSSSSESIEDIAVDPGNPLRVYAVAENTVTGGIYYSSNGADGFWNGRTAAADEWGAFYHVDVSTDGEVLVGGTAAVMTSSDGVVFSETNTGFSDFYTAHLAVASGDDDVLYAAGVWGGVMASFDGGHTWSLRNNGLEPANGQQIAVDPTDPMHVLFAAVGGLHESFDGGQNWQELDLGGPSYGIVFGVTVAPSEPSRLYARFFGLLTSDDGGQNWTEVLDETYFAVGGSPVYPVVVSYDAPATVYVGTYDQGLFVSTDAGANWSAHNSDLPNLWVNAIALDRANPQRIVIGLRDSIVMESLDGGASWTDISSNLPTGQFTLTEAVAIDDFNSDVYAMIGQPQQVFRRNAADGQWEQLGDVIAENAYSPMQLIASTQTHGRLYLQAAEILSFDLDSDADGLADGADNCVYTANADQRDTDGDQFGNLCDPDVAPPVNDCQVNFLDLNEMKQNFFVAGDLDTDLDGDNQTNFADLTIVKDLFFGGPGPSGLATCD